MPSDEEKESWTIDQITKSEFFHQKLHEWGLLEIAYELERVKGEDLEWNRKDLGITNRAWNRVIHRGIKPVRVFAHPEVLMQNPKRIGYYRMLAMVSQKSMSRVGLSINIHEKGKRQLNDDPALHISKHLNKIVSILIEHDEKIDAREFDLWRGMAAGSQAQGSWQNTKSITILIMQGVSLTLKAEKEIEKSKSIIDYFFTIEDIIGNEDVRKDLFKNLKI
jgi:hypothetical protein